MTDLIAFANTTGGAWFCAAVGIGIAAVLVVGAVTVSDFVAAKNTKKAPS